MLIAGEFQKLSGFCLKFAPGIVAAAISSPPIAGAFALFKEIAKLAPHLWTHAELASHSVDISDVLLPAHSSTQRPDNGTTMTLPRRSRGVCPSKMLLLPHTSSANGSSIRSAREPRNWAPRAPSRARWSHDKVSIIVG